MTRPTALYRFFDEDGLLLYAGVTSAGPSRWSDHEQHREWWAKVVRSTVEHYPDRASALATERVVILGEQPIYNIVHKQPPRPKATGTKRRHGAGTVIQRQDGRWAFVARIDGKQRWVNVHTEAEAELLRFCHEHRSLPRSVRDKAIEILSEVE